MRKKSCIFICIMLIISLTGCSDIQSKLQESKFIISMGFDKGEVFRLDTISCMEAEVYIYIADMQAQYEEDFGTSFWSYINNDGEKMGTRLQQNALANISQVKAMNLLANKRGIVLTEEELKKANNAGNTFYNSLNNTEIETLKIDQVLAVQMYKEFALANKVYSYIIKDINPEISDDEARTIIVRNLFLKTYSVNGLGEELEYSDEKKEETYQRILVLKERLDAGEEFDTLNLEYSDDIKRSYSIGKGETEQAYEEAAFSLSEGEISEVVETEYGYFIIQCISSFDLEQTQRNKITIMEEQKKEVFEKEYLEFVQDLPKNINSECWDQIEMIPSENLPETTFFEVYSRYFSMNW